jgi:hypothetical protein
MTKVETLEKMDPIAKSRCKMKKTYIHVNQKSRCKMKKKYNHVNLQASWNQRKASLELIE